MYKMVNLPKAAAVKSFMTLRQLRFAMEAASRIALLCLSVNQPGQEMTQSVTGILISFDVNSLTLFKNMATI